MPNNVPYQRLDLSGRSSFSGSDIDIYAMISGDRLTTNLKELDSVQVITISSFREKVPVVGLGSTNVLSYVSGGRNYAGSLITTVIEKHPLYDFILEAMIAPSESSHGFTYDEKLKRESTYNNMQRYNPDQLPPLNFILRFKNEMGNRASVVIYGVEFVHNGMTMAVEDLLTENTYQFVARDSIALIDPQEMPGADLEWLEFVSVSNGSSWTPGQIAEEAQNQWTQRASGQPQIATQLSIPKASTSVNQTKPIMSAEQWGGYKPSTAG